MSELYEYLGFVFPSLKKKKMVPVNDNVLGHWYQLKVSLLGYWYQLMTMYFTNGTS